MRDVQRATLVSNGNAKSSMTIFDALPIPVHPTTFTFPTFTTEASNGDAKELVVRRMIDSSNHGRISGHQTSVSHSLCNIFLYPQQKLGSLRGRLAKKKKEKRPGLQHLRKVTHKHLLIDSTRKNNETWKSKCGRTNAAWLQKVAVTEHWLCHRHTVPYRRTLGCRSQATHSLRAVSHSTPSPNSSL